jgi:hypothetical protein
MGVSMVLLKASEPTVTACSYPRTLARDSALIIRDPVIMAHP